MGKELIKGKNMRKRGEALQKILALCVTQKAISFTSIFCAFDGTKPRTRTCSVELDQLDHFVSNPIAAVADALHPKI